VKSFTHDALPGRVRFGVGSVESVAEEIGALERHAVLLVADALAKAVADDVADRLGPRVVGRLDETRQHVPEELAARAVTAARNTQADCVLTIGGGSATGLGKAVAIETGIPVVAVPTTYAGSEMTPIYGITGAHKRTGRDLRVLPKVVVYDPALTTGLPSEVTASSGLNALAHCVAALSAPGANPITSLLAEEGIRALARSLPGAVERPDDLEARSDVLYGAYLAGATLAVTDTGLQHKLSHVLGGSFGLVHADVHAVLLPHTSAYNAPAAPHALARVAAALGGDADPAQAGGLLHDLAAAIGAPTSLETIGMPADGLDAAAARAADQVGDSNLRAVDAAALRDLLQAAFEGRRPSG
jgi:alcohol dehydrogenase class IV